MLEEGSKVLTQRLDVLNLFNNVYISEILQKKMGVEAREADMTDGSKSYINFIHEQNKGLSNSCQ